MNVKQWSRKFSQRKKASRTEAVNLMKIVNIVRLQLVLALKNIGAYSHMNEAICPV